MSQQTKIDELLQKLQAAEMRQQQLAFDIKELRKQVLTIQLKEQPEVNPIETEKPPILIQEPIVSPAVTHIPKKVKSKRKKLR